MKSIEQLIESFEQKAQQDAYSVVSREDLFNAAQRLKNLVSMSARSKSQKMSLNSDSTNADKKSDDDNFLFFIVG